MLVLSLSLLSLYAHYRAARALDDEQLMSGWRGAAFKQIHPRVEALDRPQEFIDGWKGTLWSMKLGRVDITDPLAAAEMTVTSKRLYSPIFLSILIPVVATVVLGKVFCSWVCPASVLFEISGKLRSLLRLAEINPGNLVFSRSNKYILLLVGLVLGGVVGLPFFALVYPPAVLSRLAHAWIFGTGLTGLVLLIGSIAVFELFVSPRWWCRTMCPGGALYGLLGWPRLLRVKLDPNRCTGCGECVPVCEAGLHPVQESSGIECDNCGECIRHCPDRALCYAVSVPRTQLNHRGLSRVSSGVLAVLVLTAVPRQAVAHHILGLPHYSYKENYPQVPTLEYPATTGPYDVLLTSYPGKPTPGEAANLAFYIKNRNTDVPYDQRVSVRVLQTFTFGRNQVVIGATSIQPFENVHKLTATFPEDGEYVVELTMDVEGTPEVIPFLLIAGEPTATASVLIATGGGLGLFIVVVRAIKIKRKRRASIHKNEFASVAEASGEGTLTS